MDQYTRNVWVEMMPSAIRGALLRSEYELAIRYREVGAFLAGERVTNPASHRGKEAGVGPFYEHSEGY